MFLNQGWEPFSHRNRDIGGGDSTITGRREEHKERRNVLVTVKWQSSESLLTLRLGPVCCEELAAVAWSSSTHINYKLIST